MFKVIFEFEGVTLEPEIEDKKTIKSLHTGNDLEILDISFKTRQRFKKPEFIFSDGKKWKITNHSYSYAEGSAITKYSWHIEEVEDLKIEKLKIDDLEFKPTLYKESIEESRGNALIIESVIETTVELFQKIEDNIQKEVFLISRQGISNKEKNMRFGEFVWSRHDDKIKFVITLVETIYDEYGRSIGFLEPQFTNIQKKLLQNSKKIDYLISLLSDNEIISKDNLDELKKIDEGFTSFLPLNQVKDLDNFLEESGRYDDFEE